MSKKDMTMIVVLLVGYFVFTRLSAGMGQMRPRHDREIPLWGHTNRV